MFVEIDLTNPVIKFIPPTTTRVSRGIRNIQRNYQADAMYSLPIASLVRAINPPPFNFPLRVVAFDFESTGSNVEKDVVYQVSLVFETVFVQEGKGVKKDPQYFLLNVGECDSIFVDDGEERVTVYTFETEKMLLVKMVELLVHNEWDCITGYNIYGMYVVVVVQFFML